MKFQEIFVKRFNKPVGELKPNFIAVFFVTISILNPLSGNLWADIFTASSCSQSDVITAVASANSGDTVTIPSGTCTWGASASYVTVDEAITLQGAGQGETIINLADTGGRYTNGTIRISAAATVMSMTINGSDSAPVTAFSVTSANDWRITDIDYNGGTSGAYFIYVGNVYGLIDNNDLTGAHGSAELIMARGPTDSWQTVNSIGGADNLFIENNTFNGSGYVCDINSNGRAVIRYNTITGLLKVDGHGIASNTPARSVRHVEVYNNHWTNTSGSSFVSVEARGGVWRIYDNVIDSASALGGMIQLKEYCLVGGLYYGNCDNEYKCPSDYPIADQIGRGFITGDQDLEPSYLWNNTKGVFALSASYLANAIAACGEGDWGWEDIIQLNRDYYDTQSKPAALSGYTPYTYPHPLTQASKGLVSPRDFSKKVM